MRDRILSSLTAVLILGAFLFGTHWGHVVRDMVYRSRVAFATGRQLTFERRQQLLLDPTFAILVEVVRETPPDAVVLFPPRQVIQGELGFIPVAATASSAYSFIYPRIPVFYGTSAPNRDRVTHAVNYDHWVYKTFVPKAPRTEQNRHGIVRWPGGVDIP